MNNTSRWCSNQSDFNTTIAVPEHICVRVFNSVILSFQGPLGNRELNLKPFLPSIKVCVISELGKPNQLILSKRIVSPSDSIVTRNMSTREVLTNHTFAQSNLVLNKVFSHQRFTFQARANKPLNAQQANIRFNLHKTLSQRSVSKEGDSLTTVSLKNTMSYKSLQNTLRSLIEQLLHGIDYGFLVQLEILGVGYRVSILETSRGPSGLPIGGENIFIQLKVGFCHDVEIQVPSTIKAFSTRPTLLNLWGLDLQEIRQFAAAIRNVRCPENYQGKGIRWRQEYVVLKPGKKK